MRVLTRLRAIERATRHARHIIRNSDTAGHGLTSRFCRVPEGYP